MKRKPMEDSLLMGQKIKTLRLARGLTLCQLGELLHVSPQAVHKWESGINYPDITIIPLLARILGVSISELFGE